MTQILAALFGRGGLRSCVRGVGARVRPALAYCIFPGGIMAPVDAAGDDTSSFSEPQDLVSGPAVSIRIAV